MSTWLALRTESTVLLKEMAMSHPDDTKLRLRILFSVAQTLDGEHKAAEALKAYQEALRSVAQVPADPEVRLLQARIERDIAEEVQALGDKHSAFDHQRAALRIFEELLKGSPLNTRLRLETSWSYTETAWLEHDFHDDRAAFSDFDKAMRLLRTITAADPGNQLALLETGKLELTEAPTVERASGPRPAARVLRDAVSIFDAALKIDPTNDDARIHMAQTKLSYGDLQVRMAHGDSCSGAESYHEALAAASSVKDDRSATSVFDMQKTRDAIYQRLAACKTSQAK
jgi:tetratricopeptide (TPR) repeat protein